LSEPGGKAVVIAGYPMTAPHGRVNGRCSGIPSILRKYLTMVLHLLYCVDHPIQYQAPLLRRVAAEADIDLRVVFKSAAGAEAYFDSGFGMRVRWDVSLLDGYDSEVVAADAVACTRVHEADVLWLHGWQGKRMWRLLRTARRADVPVLMRGENALAAMPDGAGLRGLLKRRYLDCIFAHCAAFLEIGAANRAYYLDHGVAPERLFSVPYAVDNAFFRDHPPGPDRMRRWRERLRIGNEQPVILFAGKFQARKNPMTLIEAFLRLDVARIRHPCLVFVGDGEQRGALESAAAGRDDIRFTGFLNQTELREVYWLADVFVLASSREPWGLAVNEAMNCRCATVVSDECGCAADLVDDSCGRIVAAGQAAPLTTALEDILATPGKAQMMGEAAAKRIEGWNFERDVVGLRQALSFVPGRPGKA